MRYVTVDVELEADDLHAFLRDLRQAGLEAFKREVEWEQESRRREIERMFKPPRLGTYDEIRLHLNIEESFRRGMELYRKAIISELLTPVNPEWLVDFGKVVEDGANRDAEG